MTGTILLISDCDSIVSKTSAVLESLDQRISHVSDPQLISSQVGDPASLVALLALQSDELEISAIRAIRSELPGLPIYLLRREGRFFTESPALSQVEGTLQVPLRYSDLIEILRKAELARLKTADSRPACGSLIGNSARMHAVKQLIVQVAPTDANVLLTGESGTGKEVVARSIHHLSLRSGKPFVAVNCGAIPPELLESELFGHEKGAFTGAFQARAGRFELAAGGTLFLDEIGDMPLAMQVKLLRVIQERTFERVGGTRTLNSNVRLIAATHQDLEKRIDEGAFRTDLFYRLNVFPIELPPLRERREDVPLLVEEFVRRKGLARRQRIDFDPAAMNSLMQQPLPGNVRELENLVERLSILYPGQTISRERLPPRYTQLQGSQFQEMAVPAQALPTELASLSRKPGQKIDLKQYLASLERSLICRALEQTDWVVTQAAQTLSVRRTTLIEKIRKLEIKHPEARKERSVL